MTRYRSDQFFSETELASAGREPTDSTSPADSPPNQGADAPRSPADRATFFVTQFNTHKVVKTILERDGASFRHISTDDFLVSSDPDFHPTDVIEDADGSLLVINTGGWFRIGCPTSQIAKPEIAGAIYRIRREGAHDIEDPRGLAVDLPTLPARQLSTYLDDPRPAVRERAVDLFAATDDVNSHLLAELTHTQHLEQSSVLWRQNLLWAVQRSPRLGLPSVVRPLSHDAEPTLGIVAARSGGLEVLRNSSPAVWRTYAETVERPQLSRDSAQFLVLSMDQLDRETVSPVLEHALIHAAIRIGNDKLVSSFLDKQSPRVRRAALIALDQMEGGHLTREQILPLLDTDDPELQETVLTVISRREGWAAATVDLLRGWIGESELTEQRAAILRSFLSAQAGDAEIQRLIADSLQNAEVPTETRLVLLEVAERAAIEAFPDAWDAMLRANLQCDDPRLRLQAIRTIRAHERAPFDADLLALAEDQTAAADLRIEAFAAIARRLETVPDGVVIDQVLMLAGETDAVDKLRIARGLADAPLSERQLGMLADALEQIGSTPTPVLLAAFEQSASEDIGRRLVAGLESQGESLRVSASELARVLGNYPQPVQDEAAALLERLGVDLEEQAARLEELMPLTEQGDPDVGHYLFFGEKASCSRCHRIGDRGAQIGPDLSKIASIRQPRDLLEAVVFPSASFARGYRPYTVLSLDGRVESGLIARETSEEVILQTTDLREIRYDRDDVEAIAESTTSIMPQGLETRLSADELRDLLAYLQSLK
jgi:putative heme-binding domain-containing protein